MMDVKASLYQSIRKGNIKFYQSAELPLREYPWGVVGKTGLQTPLLNGVILVKNGDAAAADVDDVAAYFQKEKLPFCWWMEQSCVTPRLREVLESKGMVSGGVFPGMGVDLNKTFKEPSHEVITFTALDEWIHAISSAFQFSDEVSKGYEHLLNKASKNAYFHMGIKENGKVVSTGSVLCLENCAYIYNIATIEECRGKGYASSVTAKLLQKAKEQGNDTAALVSSPMAVSVYQKQGFETISNFEIYM